MRSFTIIVATILSTVIHFFVLTLLDTIPLVPKEVPPRPNIYMVDLLPLEPERTAPQEERAVQKKAAEVKKEEVKKEEVKKEEVKKEEPKKETVKQEEKKDTVVLEDRSKEKAKKEDKKKPLLDAEQQLSASIKEIEQKVAGRKADDAPAVTDSEIQVYVAMARERVKGFWVIPDTLSEKDLKAVIIIEIDQRGQVEGTRFEQSSGNRSFDQSAMRAVSKAAPFPPPPGQVPLEIGLIFQPR